ncbi:MAG: TonB-dependent receptor [Agriterribacter sp.]
MNKILLVVLLTLSVISAMAQHCTSTLSGYVSDTDSREKLPGATVLIKELSQSRIVQPDGFYRFEKLCPGTYTVLVTHVDCDTLELIVTIDTATRQDFQLPHQRKQLQAVTVTGEHKQDIATNAIAEIKAKHLFSTSGQTLGESLKNIPGLNAVQTGPSISKPVIHGMHSNRLLILNNGIRQEGQQWGTEHAPEIDPFIANNITIIKGAASVRYGADAIVGVILVEPKPLAPEKIVQGEANLVTGSNGLSGAVSGLLEGKLNGALNGFNWRVQGTLKRAGNFRTPHYYLKNTGLAEGDYSLATNYKKENFGAELYYSSFHNKVGIFEGSHVGNTADLYEAFKRDKPLSASFFSYDINRTYQDINHQLFKIASFYKIKNAGKIEAVYAYQKNKRDEYDIDLPYSSDPEILKRPQVSFQIKTHTLDLVYHPLVKNNFTGTYGITGSTQGNVFKGTRYLVPNFRNYGSGVFAIERYTKKRFSIEAGARYDYRWLRVYKLNDNTLQTYHNTHIYRNVTGTIGSSYRFSDKFSVSGNIGSAWRAPSVNELYINGIHLSAASYEKGDSSLRSERSYNFTFSSRYETAKFYAEVVLYDNIINNFIYAKPALQPITLISGTFPLFNYTQANVNLKGVDLELQYTPVNVLSINSKVSVVRGWNKDIHDYLIYMPADRFENTLKYQPGNWNAIQHCYISLQNVSILRQTRVPPNSDYVPPPKGYSLFNASAGFEYPVKHKTLSVELAAYNIINVAYRDYLNRFRYYADDLGINVVLRTKLIF